MKFVRTGISAAVALSALTVNLPASDTLADAIRNTELNGVLRQVYRERKTDGVKDRDGFSIGARLEGTTGEFMGLRANFGFQTSTTESIMAKFQNDTGFSQRATNMHIANLMYTQDETQIVAGRFFIRTPLVRNRHSRILKDYNEGIYMTNTSWFPNTEIMVGMVTRYQPIDQDIHTLNLDSPIYTVYANTTFDALELTAQFNTNKSIDASRDDGSKDYYLEAQYKFGADYPVTLGAQFIKWDAEDDFRTSFRHIDDEWRGNRSSHMYGLMARVDSPMGLGVGVHYTAIADEDGQVKGGWGESHDPSYNSVIITDANVDGHRALRGTVYYRYQGLRAEAYYAKFDRRSANARDNGRDITEVGFIGRYRPGGTLSGLTFETQLAKQDRKAGSPTDSSRERTQFRWYTEYRF